MPHRYLIVIFLLFSGRTGFCQEDDYARPFLMEFADKVYSQDLHTVRLYPQNREGDFPAIPLFSEEKLHFCFDDFNGGFETYYFTFIHCTWDWQPSDLSPSAYLKGFQEDQISEIKPSFNTLRPYTHYKIDLPGEVMSWNLSGNYILKVYKQGEQDQPVITKRFVVYENLVEVNAAIHPATLIEDRFVKQEVDVQLNSGNYRIDDAYKDLHTVIQQNGRYGNLCKDIQPAFVRDNEIIYQEDEKNTFNGGKEFRWFNTTNIKTPDVRVNKLRTDSLNLTHIHLYNDDKRAFKRYAFEKDINGRYQVKTSGGYNSETDADYCYVNFYFISEAPVVEGDVYVFGEFSDYRCLPANKMKFIPELKGYTAELFLKQGFYNYSYMILNRQNGMEDERMTEGSRYETENEYRVIVYHQPIGVFYDRVIGYAVFSSENVQKLPGQ